MMILFLLQDYEFWVLIIFVSPFVMPVIIPIINSTNGPFLMYVERLWEFEQKWSSLARELHDEFAFQNPGFMVETARTNVVKRGKRLAWTVGLRFSFQLQAVDEEEVAWCIANSQTSDVQDDEYENRKLRVAKVLQFEGVANEGNVFRGEHSTVVMATAVVDDADADAEPSSDVGTMAEKRTLLDFV